MTTITSCELSPHYHGVSDIPTAGTETKLLGNIHDVDAELYNVFTLEYSIILLAICYYLTTC